jgi:competence ComEA-like helix-hairpin-helix protein
MKRLLNILCLSLICSLSHAAFEPMTESPWLQGGVASALFPRSPLVMISNPSCMGLLEGSGIAVSASRPFGLRRLDRTAVAGCIMLRRCAVGAAISLSGDDAYTEISAQAAAAWKLMNGVVAGAGISARRLQISGYSRATGFSADLSLLWSPVEGIYSALLLRSVLRTDLGSSSDPAAPRSLEIALGAVPVDNVVCAVGAARQEGLDIEYTFHTAFSPSPCISLSTGVRTDPVRFWAALELSISALSMEYGYLEHSSLPGTHSVSLCWGRCESRPPSLHSTDEDDSEEIEVQFPINVNSATEQELQLIPGIGPSKASAIISWLRQNGPVSSVGDLEQVPGIGPSNIQVLIEYLVAE